MTTPLRPTWLGSVRAELTRLNRLGISGVGVGLTVLFAFVGTAVAFLMAEDIAASGAQLPPGMGELIDVASSDGLVAGLAMATDLMGVVALTLWASSAASDFATGWIRLLVQAEPRRWRLVGAKVAALTLLTLIGTLIATGVSVALANPFASSAGLPTDAWATEPLASVLGGWARLTLAVWIWGLIGLSLAILFRSAVVAIAGGIGYLVVFEGVLSFAAEDAAAWLPGSIIGAIGAGGTDDVSFAVALSVGLAIGLLLAASAGVAFARRDITS